MGPGMHVKVCDNSGAAFVKIINLFKVKRSVKLNMGYFVKVVVQSLDKKRKQRVSNKSKLKALIVKTRKKTFNSYIYLKFSKTSVILFTDSFKPVGTRNFGVLGLSLMTRQFMTKTLSLNIRSKKRI